MGCEQQKAWVNAMEMGYNGKAQPTETRQQSAIRCPYCLSYNTEFFALFGQQLLTVQYYCNSCNTPFERIKDDDVLNDYTARKEREA